MIKQLGFLLLINIFFLGQGVQAYTNDLPTEHELTNLCESLADFATHQKLQTLEVQALTEDELYNLLEDGKLSINEKHYKASYMQEANSLNKLIENGEENHISLVSVYPIYSNNLQKPSLFFKWSLVERGGFAQIADVSQLYDMLDITPDKMNVTNDSDTADTLIKLNNNYFVINSDDEDSNLLLSASLVTKQKKILPVCYFAAKPPLARQLTDAKSTLCNDIFENKYQSITPLPKIEVDKLVISDPNTFYSSKEIYLIDLFDIGVKQYISTGYQYWNSFRGDNAPTIKLLNSQGIFEGINVGDEMGDVSLSPRREMDTLYKIYLIDNQYYIDTYSEIISYHKGEQESICTFDHISQTPTQLKKVVSIPK